MPAHALISKALALLEVEIEIVYLGIRHPEILTKCESRNTSPLFWSKLHPKIGLGEILCALEQLGLILTSDGSKANFTLIVESFETFFNVKLGDPQEIKRAVFRRKLNLTTFTDAMRNALVKHSKEKIR